jgi:ABC-type multidrug transport system ATPase subunit
MSESLLSTQDLRKDFSGYSAIQGVDFSLDSGEVKGIMGPNGAGKSTFLKLLSGDIQASSGTIRLRGKRITEYELDKVSNAGVAYLPQRPSLFRPLTVRENLMGAAQTGRLMDFAGVRETVEKLLGLVSLEREANKPAGELPHGEGRLLDLALALGTRPDVLLADEPTAGIDETSAGRIVQLLADLSGSSRVEGFQLEGIVFVEHDMSVLDNLADEIGFLKEGNLLVEDKPARLRQSDIFRNYAKKARSSEDNYGDLFTDA